MSKNNQKLPWDGLGVTIAVVGDMILDEYIDGTVNRISPEAPVPVHLVRRTDVTAGGAANVARNISRIGAKAIMCGVCGNDGAADQLKQILKQDDIDVRHVLTDGERPTVRKTRVTANHQQLVRIDWEQTAPIDAALQEEVLKRLQALAFDGILISDYGKGGLPEGLITSIIALGQARKCPVVVDPKGKDYERYRGCSLMTPNRKEACEALGLDPQKDWSPEYLAHELQQRFSLGSVLVTLGADGMFGLEANEGAHYHLSAETREVFDVSGAGDTVVSVMTLCLALRLPLDRSMLLANLAAGCVVEKWGTQPVEWLDLVQALERHENQAMSEQESAGSWRSTQQKIFASRHDLAVRLDQNGFRKNRRIVFTNGCFDILHAGHISYLEEARSRGDFLVIGVNSDPSVRRLKGDSRPIIPCSERLRLLAALECVSAVVAFDEDTPRQLIEFLKPDILVKGADYEIHEIVGADTVHGLGGRVERIDLVEGLSTSEIVRRVQAGQGIELLEPKN